MKKLITRFSGLLFILLFTILCLVLLNIGAAQLGWNWQSNGKRLLVIISAAVGGAVLVILNRSLSGMIAQFRFFDWLRKHQNNDNKTSVTNIGNNNFYQDAIQSIKAFYGWRWRNRTRILLVTGHVAQVEQLLPDLTVQQWQEGDNTLLLWGGDLNNAPAAVWLQQLHGLGHRPLDGIVWITDRYSKNTALGESGAFTFPSAEQMDDFARNLLTVFAITGWRVPLYLWSLHESQPADSESISATCLLPSKCTSSICQTQLTRLLPMLVEQGTQRIMQNINHNFLLNLVDFLTHNHKGISDSLATFFSPHRQLSLAGIVFSQASSVPARRVRHAWIQDPRWDALLDSLSKLPPGLKAKKTRFSVVKVCIIIVAAMLALWGGGSVISFLINNSTIHTSQELVQMATNEKQPLATRLHALSELQKTLSRLQYQTEHGAPWYSRFGLNQNHDLLAALLPRYGENAIPLLRDAAAVHLQQQLNAYVQLPPDSPLREKMTKTAWEQLKLYLMLARPERMDAAWFSGALMQDWPQRPGVKDGIWQGSGASLLRFYGESLATHPAWRLHPDDGLISQVRTLLIRQMGMRNSESTLYQKMLAQVANQYADLHLADMTGDTDASRLFTTDEVVPGMFTRQAWEQAVQPAIEKVVTGRRDEMDWVLSDSRQPVTQQTSPEALKARLTERYFADFGGVWLDFLNSLRLQPAATLSDAIDQLTLMADVRQSPLVALMNTLSVQGRTGQTGDALSDSLVKSAKNLFNRDEQAVIDQQSGAHGPLDATFGPVLALLGNQTKGVGNSDLSLQTFLTRVTQVRLRLQQVTNATDPQAMTQALAQTVFQGKAVDLTETRDYGSLVAAGLGQEWSGFGQTVFVRPMEQAWQQVLTPAAESLNAQWRSAVVDDWNNAFGGRYPFKDVSSEVSLPLLGKYLNGDSGRITRFLQTRLSGVLHKEGSRWTADSINAQGLTFNPAFLKAMNTLSHLSDVVFTRGEAGLHFELRPGTEEGVMQTDLVIDSQKLTYMNQMPVWKRFSWPADTEAPGAALSWISTKAGTRQYADMSGAWGWIRLLDKATVSAYPGTGSSWSLSWKAQDGKALHYTLRTEAGEGPLALLKLRNFTLPAQIFSVDPAMLNGNKLTDGEYGDDDISSGAEGTE